MGLKILCPLGSKALKWKLSKWSNYIVQIFNKEQFKFYYSDKITYTVVQLNHGTCPLFMP